MATNEERISLLERDVDNGQEWRCEIAREMRAGFDRMEAKFERLEARIDRLENNHRWLIGLLVTMLIAVIDSNWLG